MSFRRMGQTLAIIFLVCILFSFQGCASEEGGWGVDRDHYPEAYWPTEEWRNIDPEAVGMDLEKLQLVYDYVANPNVNSEGFLVVKDGYIPMPAKAADKALASLK